jgi:hypothetical protein
MGKVRQWIARWFDYHLERSLQRQANKLFAKHSVEYRDGDNT